MKIPKLLPYFFVLLVILVGFVFLQQRTNISTLNQQSNNPQNLEKEYRIAEGKVFVLEKQSKKEITTIDLSTKEGDFTINYTPHFTKLAKDKKFLWLTASAPKKQFASIEKRVEDHTHLLAVSDQVIVIDTETNKIIKKIGIGMQLGVRDLIFTPDENTVYIAAETGMSVYKINTSNYKVDLIQLPIESFPHQLSISYDGKKIYAKSKDNKKVFLIENDKVIESNDNEVNNNLSWSKH